MPTLWQWLAQEAPNNKVAMKSKTKCFRRIIPAPPARPSFIDSFIVILGSNQSSASF